MPKVLRIINRFNLGGITYNVAYLSRHLSPAFETLLVGGPEEKAEQSSLFIPESLGLKPLVIEELRRSINPLADYYAYRRIRKIIREFKPDIVHTHASKAGAIGRLAASHSKVPVIVHTFHGHVFHGYFGKFGTMLVQRIERYLAKKSHQIIAISTKQKHELATVYNICEPSKIEVIRLGFDLGRFTIEQPAKRQKFRNDFMLNGLCIGIIGRLAPIKNHFLFIDALVALQHNTTQPFRAVIIGDGETREALTGYLRQKNVTFSDGPHPTATVIFAGWIREVDVALAGLDIVCLTSKNEGTPVSLIEAQAASKLIVTTNVGGISDILHPGCGLLSEAGDDAGFINNLTRAVTHFEELDQQVKSANTLVVEQFGYQRLCNEMATLYHHLLKKINR